MTQPSIDTDDQWPPCEVCTRGAEFRWRIALLPEGEWRDRCAVHITSVTGNGLMIVRRTREGR
jgi:hypothetical protein